MLMKYLKLTIKAPLMSFGDASSQYQNVRDTATNPTKSMIVGMVACAMGIDRKDSRVEELSKSIIVKTTTINKNATLWRDYQNAHIRGFDKQGHYGSKNDKNIQRWKTYIANGSYIVFVGCEDDVLLKNIYSSLQRPYWPLFVGRKCCTLSSGVVSDSFVVFDEQDIHEEVKRFNDEMGDFVLLCTCQ